MASLSSLTIFLKSQSQTPTLSFTNFHRQKKTSWYYHIIVPTSSDVLVLLKVGLRWVYAGIRLALVNKEVLALADRWPPPLSPAQTLDSGESDNPIQFGMRRPNPVCAEREQNQLFTFPWSGQPISHFPKHTQAISSSVMQTKSVSAQSIIPKVVHL